MSRPTYIVALEDYLNSHGHVHVFTDGGLKVEVYQDNVKFYDDHLEVDEGLDYPDIVPYDHICGIEVPHETTE